MTDDIEVPLSETDRRFRDASTERPADLVAAVHALRGPSKRRHKLPPGECNYCDGEKGTFHPPHDASERCESGMHAHCSCDTCF